MTNIIEHTYTALANTGELHLTEKDYSTNYLGRCKSYYAYLKSTGRQASTEVLLKLWTQLKKAEQEANEANTNHTSKQFFFKKHQPSHLQKTAQSAPRPPHSSELLHLNQAGVQHFISNLTDAHSSTF